MGLIGVVPRVQHRVTALDHRQVRVPRIQLGAPQFLAIRDELEDVLLAGGEEPMKAEGADGELHGE